MARAPAKFTQADLSRALKAAKSAGVFVRIEIEPKKITIVQLPDNAADAVDELARFRRQHGYG